MAFHFSKPSRFKTQVRVMTKASLTFIAQQVREEMIKYNKKELYLLHNKNMCYLRRTIITQKTGILPSQIDHHHCHRRC